MDELIQLATSQLGMSEDGAKGATQGVFGLLKDQMSDGDFGALANAIPGVADAVGGGGDAGGGLMGALGSALGGGGASGALGLAAAFMQGGADANQLAPFIKLVMSFIQSKASEGVLQTVLSSVPEISELLGAS